MGWKVGWRLYILCIRKRGIENSPPLQQVLNEKSSVAKDLAAAKLALQESQIKVEREVQERRSLEHDLKMARERLEKQKEAQADELQKAEKELTAVANARSDVEAQRSDVVAEMSQVGVASCLDVDL